MKTKGAFSPVKPVLVSQESAAASSLEQQSMYPSLPASPHPIFEIQGAGHRSPLEGQRVQTVGVVTDVMEHGFYIQDPAGDGNNQTSDAIFVSTKKPLALALGDRILLEGTVEEFAPNESSLSRTQLSDVSGLQVLGTGHALPDAVQLGNDEFPYPTDSIDEAASLYESLEGMRVEFTGLQVVGASNKFGDAFVIPELADIETTEKGVIRGRPGEELPERLKLSVHSERLGVEAPRFKVSDHLTGATGTFTHNYGFYGLNVSSLGEVTLGDLEPDVTTLEGTEWGMTVATYNVENLDVKVEDEALLSPGGSVDDDLGDGKFDALAEHMVHNLKKPDILALQEIQDNDGTEDTSVVSGSEVYEALMEKIVEAGGPRYEYIEMAPVDDAEGGQPGGNIRVGYLFNPERVDLVEGSVERVGIGHSAFNEERGSLAAAFRFKPTGESLHIVNNHLASKYGSTPTYRNPDVPEVIAGTQERVDQQDVVLDYIHKLQAENPDAKVVSVGDFNAPEHDIALQQHGADTLFNFGDDVPDEERYSYGFQGVAEPIDHQLGTRNMKGKVEFEYIHVNADFVDKASDHDPTISRINMLPSKTSPKS
ncbi:MAG: hypothetical protein EP343_12860 [Deltaproteobacteria bacterium]|nr:MAG: hypothetical protein EP343_12860 [Deltaproteobacteria bacterium]